MSVIIDEKTNEEITVELLSQVPDTYQKNVGFFIWDFMRAISVPLSDLWGKLSYLTAFFDISRLDYDDLVKFAFQRRGIVAQTATTAIGDLKITGTCNISIGDLFETSSGLQFEATENKTITTTGTVQIQCKTSGSVGNVPVGAITVVPVTIQGLTSVTNESALSGGYDAESKEHLLNKYFEDIQSPIISGNIYHYKKWAKEVAGVGDAKIKPLWNGDNTVKVVIVDANNEVASQTLINTVQNYIDPSSAGTGLGQAPIGAYCTVTSATAKDIDVSVEIEVMTGATLAQATQNIENSIKNYFKSTVFVDSYISYAKIGACILNADGVKDYNSLLVNNDTDNIALTDNNTITEIAVLDDLTVTEEE